jgi:hypothetical protein
MNWLQIYTVLYLVIIIVGIGASLDSKNVLKDVGMSLLLQAPLIGHALGFF